MLSLDEKIKQAEEARHLQEARIANSKFMPQQEEFDKLNRLTRELAELQNLNDKRATGPLLPYQRSDK